MESIGKIIGVSDLNVKVILLENNVKIGETILNRFVEDLADVSTVEKKPFLEGKTMFVILSKKI